MKIKPFHVEQWMNEYETRATFNIAETCVESISLNEVFALTKTDKAAFLDAFCARPLTYGDIEGLPQFLTGVSSLYKTIKSDEVITTHGAAGANHHVFYSLIEPSDHVISIMPTYQQLYDIPRSFGAEVTCLPLRKENAYLPDLEELQSLIKNNTKMICINNPNNPTGAFLEEVVLQGIVDIAKAHDLYVLCDEVYRHLTQDNSWSTSIVDLYDKGISVSSMSKVFSLAGLRLGWITTHDKTAIRDMLIHRDYNLISGSLFDEAVAGHVLAHKEPILERNRQMVQENLTILDTWVNNEPHISYVKPVAGTTALVRYDFDTPTRELCVDMFEKKGILVTPGSCFEEEHAFRVGYGNNKQVLIDGLAALSEYLQSL